MEVVMKRCILVCSALLLCVHATAMQRAKGIFGTPLRKIAAAAVVVPPAYFGYLAYAAATFDLSEDTDEQYSTSRYSMADVYRANFIVLEHDKDILHEICENEPKPIKKD
jgi:hypothetical protein